MAISPNIKYDFNQIQTALIAFVGDLELKMQNLIPDLPVFVLQTGDMSYFLNTKFGETENKEIMQKVPRFIITFGEIQPNTEENSNKYNKITYLFENKPYRASVRRMAFNFDVTTDLVSSNFVKMLENFELMATLIVDNNVFTYEFMGNTYECAYGLTSNTQEKPPMDFGGASRNFSVKTGLELQLHLMVPRVKSIILLDETGFEVIVSDIQSDSNDPNFVSLHLDINNQ